MSDRAQDALLLTLTAIAAVGGVTGVWLLILAWIDRPQHMWGIAFVRELIVEEPRGRVLVTRQKSLHERHKLTVIVSAIGSRSAFDVTFRVHGCSVIGSVQLKGRTQMTPAAEPVELEISIPDGEGEPALLEILWLQHRPHRHRGQRIDLRTGKTNSYWRWSWLSLRFRGWRRLSRTNGRWIERKARDCPEIPDTKGAAAVGK
jgi:hypothetical protein